MAQNGVGAPAKGSNLGHVQMQPFWDPHRLNQDRALGTSSFKYFTSTPGRTYVDRVIFTNYTGVARLVTLRWVQSSSGAAGGPGGGKLDDNSAVVVPAVTVNANDVLVYPFKAFLEANDYLTAFADLVGSCNILILGGLEQ